MSDRIRRICSGSEAYGYIAAGKLRCIFAFGSRLFFTGHASPSHEK